MRSNDASVMLQSILSNGSPVYVNATQYEGVYYGYVHQTHATTGSIPVGQMTLVIPGISSDHVWGPVPYPGAYPPPLKTTCSLSWGIDNNPVVLAFYGFSAGIVHYGAGYPSSSVGNIGDIYIDTQGVVYNGPTIVHQGPNIYGPKTSSGWGSPTPIA